MVRACDNAAAIMRAAARFARCIFQSAYTYIFPACKGDFDEVDEYCSVNPNAIAFEIERHKNME